MGRRPRIPIARSTNPFDRAGHRSTCSKCSLLNSFVARGIFALCLMRLCHGLREKERGASTWQVPLVALCSSSSFICLKKAATTAGIERPIKIFLSSSTCAYHFLVPNISKARMNNNQRNKSATAPAPACGSSGARGQWEHQFPFAIRPKGARKHQTGRRVAMPKEQAGAVDCGLWKCVH